MVANGEHGEPPRPATTTISTGGWARSPLSTGGESAIRGAHSSGCSWALGPIADIDPTHPDARAASLVAERRARGVARDAAQFQRCRGCITARAAARELVVAVARIGTIRTIGGDTFRLRSPATSSTATGCTGSGSPCRRGSPGAASRMHRSASPSWPALQVGGGVLKQQQAVNGLGYDRRWRWTACSEFKLAHRMAPGQGRSRAGRRMAGLERMKRHPHVRHRR